MKLGELMRHADAACVRVKVIKDHLPRGFVDYVPESIPAMLDRYGECSVQKFQTDSAGIEVTIEVE